MFVLKQIIPYKVNILFAEGGMWELIYDTVSPLARPGSSWPRPSGSITLWTNSSGNRYDKE